MMCINDAKMQYVNAVDVIKCPTTDLANFD